METHILIPDCVPRQFLRGCPLRPRQHPHRMASYSDDLLSLFLALLSICLFAIIIYQFVYECAIILLNKNCRGARSVNMMTTTMCRRKPPPRRYHLPRTTTVRVSLSARLANNDDVVIFSPQYSTALLPPNDERCGPRTIKESRVE